MSDPAEIHVPFRFRSTDAKRLYQLARYFESEGHGREDVTLFALAAKSAKDGEALDVVVARAEEVEQVVAGFARWGVTASVG